MCVSGGFRKGGSKFGLSRPLPVTLEVRTEYISRSNSTVADLGGVRGVQMHPPLVASNVFLL